MSILLFLFVVLALWHFIYEGVLLPSIRLNLRNRLFRLRDELCRHGAHSDFVDIVAFKLVLSGMDNCLGKLQWIDLSLPVGFQKKVQENPELLVRLEERRNMLASSQDEKLKDIFRRANSLLEYAFLANSGAWFVYLLPIAFVFLFIGHISKQIEELLMLPSSAVSKVFPKGLPA